MKKELKASRKKIKSIAKDAAASSKAYEEAQVEMNAETQLPHDPQTDQVATEFEEEMREEEKIEKVAQEFDKEL